MGNALFQRHRMVSERRGMGLDGIPGRGARRGDVMGKRAVLGDLVLGVSVRDPEVLRRRRRSVRAVVLRRDRDCFGDDGWRRGRGCSKGAAARW